MRNAYAVRMNEDNYGAIASEKPGFDLGEARSWVESFGPGFFVRDENDKRTDCRYLPDEMFFQMYVFDGFDEKAVFHKIVRINNG